MTIPSPNEIIIYLGATTGFLILINHLISGLLASLLIILVLLGSFVIFNRIIAGLNENADQWSVIESKTKPDSPIHGSDQIKADHSKINRNATFCLLCMDTPCYDPDHGQFQIPVSPWRGLKVNESVDEAITQILNITLDRYVESWYLAAGGESDFIDEVRTLLRHMLANLLLRVSKLDLEQVILHTVPRLLINHIEMYISGKRRAKNAVQIQEAVLREYNDRLHPALESRASEASWLRARVEQMLPYLIPAKYLNCPLIVSLLRDILTGVVLMPALDAASDPDVANAIIAAFFDPTSVDMPESPSHKLTSTEPGIREILAKYDVTKRKNNSNKNNTGVNIQYPLGISLKKILNDQQLLFLFMEFLKSEAHCNLAQFLLACDSFNQRLLNPELTLEELSSLHSQAIELYHTFFSTDAPGFIPFGDEIVGCVKRVVEGQPADVQQFRTSAALYKSYDQVYEILELHFTPLFLQSDYYFKLISGQRWTASDMNVTSLQSNASDSNKSKSRQNSAKSHRRTGSTASATSTTFEDPEEGIDLLEAMEPDEISTGSNGDGSPVRWDSISGNDTAHSGGINTALDLSQWTVTIPKVETGMDVNCRYYHFFVLEVERPEKDAVKFSDSGRQHGLRKCTVERRYNEFYVLESKLREFHESLCTELIPLPSKNQLLRRKTMEFMRSRRPVFEQFLQQLLTIPCLKRSQLVRNFLWSPQEFSSSFLPDIRLGKMIKSVPAKLTAERGQNLDHFLVSLITSTEAPKPKPGKAELKSIFNQSPDEWAETNLRHQLYGDNMASFMRRDSVGNIIPLEANKSSVGQESDNPVTRLRLTWIYDYAIVLLVRLYDIDVSFLKLLAMLEPVLRPLTEWGARYYLHARLVELFAPKRVISMAHSLRDILYFNETTRSVHDKRSREKGALKRMRSALPPLLVKHLIGDEKYEEKTFLFFRLFQYPLLNKQLLYLIVEQVVMNDLFPELVIK